MTEVLSNYASDPTARACVECAQALENPGSAGCALAAYDSLFVTVSGGDLERVTQEFRYCPDA